MQIILHLGFDPLAAQRLQAMIRHFRRFLRRNGVLPVATVGLQDALRLQVVVTDPDHIDPIRANRGLSDPQRQAEYRAYLADQISQEIDSDKPEKLILSSGTLGQTLYRPSELARLRAFLSQFSDDIQIVAHIEEPARALAHHYATQLREGRETSLVTELQIAQSQDSWWQACLDEIIEIDPARALFAETQMPPFWLDYAALLRFWQAAFGPESMRFRSFAPVADTGRGVAYELLHTFDLPLPLRRPPRPAPAPDAPSAAWLARLRQQNSAIIQVLENESYPLPRTLRPGFAQDCFVDGAPLDPGSLSLISERFHDSNARLQEQFPALGNHLLDAPKPAAPWQEADPKFGFRATQYLVPIYQRLREAAEQARQDAEQKKHAERKPILSDSARDQLPEAALEVFENLIESPRFWPHNDLGNRNETAARAPFPAAPARALPDESTGTVAIACVKNEAPFILEWVAYHRSIGIDNFLIYSNDCTDGSRELLERLDALGVIQHRRNDDWSGPSPQQHALSCAQTEAVVLLADWIVHFDLDEFINIRTGNGTLDCLRNAVPDATHIAMTWRLFGHNGVTRFEDRPILEQFDHCAPRYCPKPHTVWGYKTLFRNNGAYARISAHRPNELDEMEAEGVKWVNGSGADVTPELIEGSWRTSRKSTGYDLVQLNHYPLRSAESFLVKRDRGRALHVARKIGFNYWVRMDWSDHRDITIQRNLPRLRAEMARLLADPQLAQLQALGVARHIERAQTLMKDPDMAQLYQQITNLPLSASERVAYCGALNLET